FSLAPRRLGAMLHGRDRDREASRHVGARRVALRRPDLDGVDWAAGQDVTAGGAQDAGDRPPWRLVARGSAPQRPVGMTRGTREQNKDGEHGSEASHADLLPTWAILA